MVERLYHKGMEVGKVSAKGAYSFVGAIQHGEGCAAV